MPKLVGIADTEANRRILNPESGLPGERSIFRYLEDEYKAKTFREFLEYLTKNPDEEERPIAEEIQRYMREHNGSNVLMKINVYDENGNKKESLRGSSSFSLDDIVTPYIDTRRIEDREYECIEIIVSQLSAVGGQ
ncbi:MAG: hypothetical protein ABIB71_07050 [Candidatus Woesearchaeota archaeon]